jgi:hypothetical protein
MATTTIDIPTVLDLLPKFEWGTVVQALRLHPFRTSVRVPKSKVPHPLSRVGFRESIGDNVGQLKDFRLVQDDGSGLHVHDFGTHYEAHLDQVDPQVDLIAHAYYDAPPYFALGAGVFAGIIAYACGAKAEGIAAVSVGTFAVTNLLIAQRESAQVQ